jgi:hypothetical protein
MLSNLIGSTSPLQIYGLNAFAFVISFTDANQSMKLVLLFASIVFTVVKTLDIIRKWKEDKK